ncbi:MAG: GDSL-type esterase/lipase family protein, partial [Verrucomicrobiota bacterium]
MRKFLALLLMAIISAAVGGDSFAAENPSSKLSKPFANGKFTLESGDVVAFLGGTDVAAAQFTGHLETLLTAKYRNAAIRFRNFGWEGDTVFSQPRDIGFPTLKMLMERELVSVIVLQFGRMESLGGREGLPEFVAAYEKFLNECVQQTRRVLLVTPPPFEKSSSPLPDLSARNSDLAEYAKAIRKIARQRELPLVDLFGELTQNNHERLTENGLQLTTRGQAM